MSNPAIIICILGVATAIFLNYKFHVNVGITDIAFAWFVGCFMLRTPVKELVAAWPTSLVFQMMSISLFFGFAICNGTMQAVASHLLYKVRTSPLMIALALYFIPTILGFIGCSPPAAVYIGGVIGFSVGLSIGLHPAIIAWAVVMGSNVGACVPWGAQGVTVKSVIASNGFEAQAEAMTWRFQFAMFVLTTVILIALFFLLKGYRLSTTLIEKPEPFTWQQRANLGMIFGLVGLVVLSSLLPRLFPGHEILAYVCSCLDIQLLTFVGFLLCSALKLADPREAVNSVPWGNLLMVGGIGILMSVIMKAGIAELLYNWLSSGVPAWVRLPFMTLMGGFLSFFSSAIPAAFPVLAPMVAPAVAGTAIKPVTMFISILIGCCYTSISPFSSGGSLLLSTCRDEALRSKLLLIQLGLAGGSLLTVAALGALRILNVF